MQTNNVIVVSDLHCGCRLGLFPSKPMQLDSGLIVAPSDAQKVMWGWWEEFWNVIVPREVKHEPFDVVVNGDMVDGVHHRSTTQISQNMEDQRRIAMECMRVPMKKARRLFVVRGTEAHVGQSAEHEEALAKNLGAIARNGEYARWELWLRVGDGLVHFLHHVGTTSSSAHESSAVNAELTAEFVEAARWGKPPPDVIVRSHRHRCIEVRIPVKRGFASALVTPAWQLKTPFTFKVPGARLAPPQIGGVLIRKGTKHLYTWAWVNHIERPDCE